MTDMLIELSPPVPALDDETRWQVFADRDVRYDGQFFVAVTSTRIVCRPSCSARPPHRQNVRFYDTLESARAAGFRPCKRCQPERVAADAALVAQVARFIETDPTAKHTLESLAADVGYSPFHVQRVFKRATGLSPRQYNEALRVRDFRARLRDPELGTVTEAAFDAGYQSLSVLYECDSTSGLGMPPSHYRKGGEGAQIAYAVVASPFGRLLVAATERGVCKVSLCDSDESLVDDLRAEYPSAHIAPGGEMLDALVNQVLAGLTGDLPHADLPLDIRATAFQWRVWRALCQIPRGETRTYSEIAEAIGQPSAARAVAGACAANRVAVLIPCHRVVREDGDLGGYRWGLSRKSALLKAELGE